MNRTEKFPHINFIYLITLCVVRTDPMDFPTRGNRTKLKKEIKDIIKNPKAKEVYEGFIYYRWYYSDDSEDYGVHRVANGPRIRWLLYTTARENPGMFFYRIHQQDLAINPMAGTPRIGPFAPPIPPKSKVPFDKAITRARKRTIDAFNKRLKDAVDLAEQDNAGKIHCRCHFTDPKNPISRVVTTKDNTQAVRDLLTEYLVKYPNQ